MLENDEKTGGEDCTRENGETVARKELEDRGEKIGMNVGERGKKKIGWRTREGGNKRYSKKLKISSVLRHSLGHMVTGIYHIRSQFLTRWEHISRDSGGYNHSLLKIQ